MVCRLFPSAEWLGIDHETVQHDSAYHALCGALIAGKRCLPHPGWLRNKGVKLIELRQKASTIIAGSGGCFHFGELISAESTTMAVNVCPERWLDIGPKLQIQGCQRVVEFVDLIDNGRLNALASRLDEAAPFPHVPASFNWMFAASRLHELANYVPHDLACTLNCCILQDIERLLLLNSSLGKRYRKAAWVKVARLAELRHSSFDRLLHSQDADNAAREDCLQWLVGFWERLAPRFAWGFLPTVLTELADTDRAHVMQARQRSALFIVC